MCHSLSGITCKHKQPIKNMDCQFLKAEQKHPMPTNHKSEER
jgi:hypothetical protein